LSTEQKKVAGMTTVVVVSSMIAGPAMTLPATSFSPS
jgi:hypothetical protein